MFGKTYDSDKWDLDKDQEMLDVLMSESRLSRGESAIKFGFS